jgi:peptidoglycan/xylan/chitin deacetylase (PgdA/CDA1 family)
MRHFIRDIIILCIHFLGIAALYRNRAQKRGPLVRVIAFHDVEDRDWFERVIAMLVQEFNVITPAQFHQRDFSKKRINVLVTFDDGYQSWIDNVLPVLKLHGLKGLFFINSGLLDVADDKVKSDAFMSERLIITSKEALSWEGARRLVSGGHILGGHTAMHHNLASLEADRIEEEIQSDKKRTESNLGIVLADFAYPFGAKKHYTEVVVAAVKQAGYTYAYTARSRFIGEDRHRIPRTLFEKNQSLFFIKLWVLGGYDIFSFIK